MCLPIDIARTVPKLTLLGNYLSNNYNQFEIVGWSRHNNLNMDGGYWEGGCNDATINGKLVYRRILIKRIFN